MPILMDKPEKIKLIIVYFLGVFYGKCNQWMQEDAPFCVFLRLFARFCQDEHLAARR